MKKILLVSILLIPLMLAGNEMAYAGGEPGGRVSIIGPTMDGVVWLTPPSIYQGCIDGVFLGNCNGKPFAIERLGVFCGNLGDVVAAGQNGLLNFVLLDAGPVGCRSISGGEDLIITAVKNFSKGETQVLADVDLKFVIPK